MKRFFSLLFASIFICLIVSCSAADEIVPEYDNDIDSSAIDLRGQTLVMGMVKDYFFEGSDSTLTFITNTEFGDLAAKRIKDVETKYNCKINFDYVTRSGETAYFSVASGSYIFDMLQEESYWLLNYLPSGTFVNLVGVDNLDVFDETKWGNRYLRMSTMYDGAIYGLLPAQHPLRLSNSPSNLIAINEKYISDLVTTDPRDYFENGEWNWDTFGNAIESYAHTSSTTNEFVYSLGSCFGYGRMFMIMPMCNGCDFIKMNDNDTYQLGYFTQNAMDAYNQVAEWLFGATAGNINNETFGLDQFIDGQSVMTLIDAYQILSSSESIAYRMDNFGIVPFPCGPGSKSPYDYTTSYESADFTLAIPITAKDPEISALVLDALYEPFEGYETEEKITDYIIRNYFEDERDARLFMDITKLGHNYYHDHMHGMTEMFTQLANNVSIARCVESYEDRMYNIVDKYVIPEYNTIREYEEYFHE
jgi:ABC-type glycerol-3-phosphate transport system substrate-binding protein